VTSQQTLQELRGYAAIGCLPSLKEKLVIYADLAIL